HQEAIRQRLGSRDNGFMPFDVSGDETIPEMFSRQVRVHPEKTAIISGRRRITYRELEQVSRDVHSVIAREIDGSQTPIAVLVADQADFVASILGILRSGSFYVPLDPSFPEDRNSRILR